MSARPAVGASAQAERISASVFLVGRAGQLAFSALMLVGDRRSHSRPRLQAAAFAATAIESLWLARRIRRARRYDDPLGLWVDAAVSAGAVVASAAGLGDGNAAPWAKNVAIGAALGAAGAGRRRDGLGAMGLVELAAVVNAARPGGRDRHVGGAALAVNDTVNWAGMYAAARAYLEAHRRYAALRDAADTTAVAIAAERAAEIERARQHEQLHRVTIDVLRGIADSDDLTRAVARARTEAARLRYALRTGGRIPPAVDTALADAVGPAIAGGMRVELVTAELVEPAAPELVEPLAYAVRSVLAAAADAGAGRCVLRAVSAANGVTVTLRHPGDGFAPGSGGTFERHLDALTDEVRPAGWELAVWSEPGEGVRVTLHGRPAPDGLDVGGRGPDQAAHHVPDRGSGRGAADDRDTLAPDRHLDSAPGSGPGAVSASQHDIGAGPGVLEDLDGGRPRQPEQPRPEQGRTRLDDHRGRLRHRLRMTGSAAETVGRTTPFHGLPAADTRPADRTLMQALLAWRLSGLATGAAALVAGRARFHSRPMAYAQFAAVAAESAWFARRIARLDRWDDPPAAAMDAITAVAALAAGHANLATEHRSTWINWAPWAFAANAVCAEAMGVADLRRAGTGAGLVIGTFALQSRRSAEGAANAAALMGFFTGARVFARLMRDSAERLATARETAVDESESLAASRERARQLRLLHDQALQTLETLAAGRFTSLAAARARAGDEADRLEDEVSGARPTGDFLTRLGNVIERHRAAGLTIETELPPHLSVAETSADALSLAANEALTNVAKHAQARVVRIAVRPADDGVIVTISDDGVGFVTGQPRPSGGGFGMGESITRRMSDAEGVARIRSTPGHGTEVVLVAPR